MILLRFETRPGLSVLPARGRRSMDNRVLYDIGIFQGVRFSARRLDPVQADVDLLVAGMPVMGAAAESGGEPCALDAALMAILSQLQAGGVFEGRFGDRLVLDQLLPPFSACSLLVIGMGDPANAGPAEIGRLAAIAARSAQKLRHRSIGVLCKLPQEDASAQMARALGAAIMGGILRTMSNSSAGIQCLSQDCIFDLRAPHIAPFAQAMRQTLEHWRR